MRIQIIKNLVESDDLEEALKVLKDDSKSESEINDVILLIQQYNKYKKDERLNLCLPGILSSEKKKISHDILFLLDKRSENRKNIENKRKKLINYFELCDINNNYPGDFKLNFIAHDLTLVEYIYENLDKQPQNIFLILGHPLQGKTHFCKNFTNNEATHKYISLDLPRLSNDKYLLFVEEPLKFIELHYKFKTSTYNVLVIDGFNEFRWKSTQHVQDVFKLLISAIQHESSTSLIITCRFHFILNETIYDLLKSSHVKCMKLKNFSTQDLTTLLKSPLMDKIRHEMPILINYYLDFPVIKKRIESHHSPHLPEFSSIIDEFISKPNLDSNTSQLVMYYTASYIVRSKGKIPGNFESFNNTIYPLSDEESSNKTLEILYKLKASTTGSDELVIRRHFSSFPLESIYQNEPEFKNETQNPFLAFLNEESLRYLYARFIIVVELGENLLRYRNDSSNFIRVIWRTFTEFDLDESMMNEIIKSSNEKIKSNKSHKEELLSAFKNNLDKIIESHLMFHYKLDVSQIRENPIKKTLSGFYRFWKFIRELYPDVCFEIDNVDTSVNFLTLINYASLYPTSEIKPVQNLSFLKINLQASDDIEFSRFEFSASNFSNTKVIGLNLQSSKLLNNNMNESHFIDFSFKNIEISFLKAAFSKWEEGEFENVLFTSCEFTDRAEFGKVRFLNDTKFTETKFESTNFLSCEFNRLSFFKTTFSGECKFTSIIFEECTFEFSVLSGENLSGVTIKNSVFQNRTMLISTNFTQSNLDSVTFKNSNLYKINLHSAKFDVSEVNKDSLSIIERCRLNNAILEKVVAQRLLLKNMSIQDINVKDSVWYKCEFQGITFEGGDFENASFLEDCSFKDCVFYGIDLRNAKFQKSDLVNVTFSNCDFSNNDSCFDGSRFKDVTVEVIDEEILDLLLKNVISVG